LLAIIYDKKNEIMKTPLSYLDPSEKSTLHTLFLRDAGNPVEFLRFHVDNSIHSITTGMNPIRNMNHKRKYLLNRLQEYQLQYLLSKEESFQ